MATVRFKYVGWARCADWPQWRIACRGNDSEACWCSLEVEHRDNKEVLDLMVLRRGEHPLGPTTIQAGESPAWDGKTWRTVE